MSINSKNCCYCNAFRLLCPTVNHTIFAKSTKNYVNFFLSHYISEVGLYTKKINTTHGNFESY